MAVSTIRAECKDKSEQTLEHLQVRAKTHPQRGGDRRRRVACQGRALFPDTEYFKRAIGDRSVDVPELYVENVQLFSTVRTSMIIEHGWPSVNDVTFTRNNNTSNWDVVLQCCRVGDYRHELDHILCNLTRTEADLCHAIISLLIAYLFGSTDINCVVFLISIDRLIDSPINLCHK